MLFSSQCPAPSGAIKECAWYVLELTGSTPLRQICSYACFPLGKGVAPLGKGVAPLGKGVAPRGKASPRWGKASPRWGRRRPAGERRRPAGERLAPLGNGRGKPGTSFGDEVLDPGPPHPRQPPLQVFPLGMGDRHRMVRRGGEGLQEIDADARLDGGGEEDLAEELGVHRAAAAEGEEEAARLDPRQGQAVEVLVGAGRGVEVRPLAHQRRRIADDQAVSLLALAEVLEDVRLHPFEALGVAGRSG